MLSPNQAKDLAFCFANLVAGPSNIDRTSTMSSERHAVRLNTHNVLGQLLPLTTLHPSTRLRAAHCDTGRRPQPLAAMKPSPYVLIRIHNHKT